MIKGQQVLWLRHSGLGQARVPCPAVVDAINPIKQTADLRFADGSARGDIPLLEIITDPDLVLEAVDRLRQALGQSSINSQERFGRHGLS
jgi:hypothetical protein